METIGLVDFSAIWWSAFYSTTGKLDEHDPVPWGDIEGAVMQRIAGFDNLDLQPLYLCIDAKRTWRHDMYGDYKGHRPPKPPGSIEAMIDCLTELEGLGHRVRWAENMEADDVMATLAQQAYDRGDNATIISADKDMAQCLMAGRVNILNPASRDENGNMRERTQESLRQRLRIEPWQVPHWLALVGDSSDNLPGVKGIGVVKASRLLEEGTTLDELIERDPVTFKPDKSGLTMLQVLQLTTLVRNCTVKTWHPPQQETKPVSQSTIPPAAAPAATINPEPTPTPPDGVLEGALCVLATRDVASSQHLDRFAVAFAKAQGDVGIVSKNKVNPHFKSDYADLAQVISATKPALAANGISALQMPCKPHVITVLLHSSGQWLGFRTPVISGGKTGPQAYGASVTYARRYSLAAITGTAQEDDDGEGAYNPPARAAKK